MSMTGSTRLSNAASAPLRRPRAASGRLLRGVLALSPRVSALYTSLCCFLFFALLSNAAAASPKSASSPLNATQAQDQFYSMELEQAADSYRKLLAVDPENPDYWTSLAHVYLFQQLQRMGKFENDIFPAAAAITPAGRETREQCIVALGELFPKIAKMAGFPRPILHGLCSYGTACRAVLKTICNYDHTMIAGFDVRFSAPVFPGETIVTEMWKDRNIVSFRSKVKERDVVVINNGKCTLRA